ncbi:MAG: glycosyltransferase, partial [Anaerolineae bacterium]|nr:glycosyltransferase [Anaerolineae bacterium]
MENQPHLSILLPVRNEGLNLRIMIKILGAVLEVPYEIVVVCDSLEDESIPVVRSMQAHYPQVRLVINT